MGPLKYKSCGAGDTVLIKKVTSDWDELNFTFVVWAIWDSVWCDMNFPFNLNVFSTSSKCHGEITLKSLSCVILHLHFNIFSCHSTRKVSLGKDKI